MNIELKHENDRIFAENHEGKLVAEITFPKISDTIINISHTFVHESLRGQSVADQLMRAVVETAQSNHLKVIASCSYALSWATKHPEITDLFIDRDS